MELVDHRHTFAEVLPKFWVALLTNPIASNCAGSGLVSAEVCPACDWRTCGVSPKLATPRGHAEPLCCSGPQIGKLT